MRATLTLRQLLLEGAFQPGERIREVPLAARIGVSSEFLCGWRWIGWRMKACWKICLRAALWVQEFTTSDVYDAIELRGTVEGVAARFAAERLKRSASPDRSARV